MPALRSIIFKRILVIIRCQPSYLPTGYCILSCLNQEKSALSLFVFRVLTDDSDGTFPFDDFALFANRFYGCSYFHLNLTSFQKDRFILYHAIFDIAIGF